MKKIYLVGLMLSSAAFSFGQHTAVNPANIGFKPVTVPVADIAAGEDTLGLEDFSTQAGTIFDIDGGGYFFGTYALDTSIQTFPTRITNDALGRGFIANDPYNVTGAMIWFSVVEGVNASPADLTVSLHDLAENVSIMDENSDPQNPDGPGPGTELASQTLPFADVNDLFADGPTYVMFDEAAYVGGDLALVLDYADLYGANGVDTIVVIAEQDGSGSADGTYSWVYQVAEVTTPAGTQNIPLWLSAKAYLGIESDIAIFAIVEESGVGIEEQGFMSGVKMTTYPNPAVSGDVIRVQYGLEAAAERVEINIHDMNGKLVHSIAEGDKVAGIHTIEIPAGTLSAGSYVYSLQANQGRLAKRLEILK